MPIVYCIDCQHEQFIDKDLVGLKVECESCKKEFTARTASNKVINRTNRTTGGDGMSTGMSLAKKALIATTILLPLLFVAAVGTIAIFNPITRSLDEKKWIQGKWVYDSDYTIRKTPGMKQNISPFAPGQTWSDLYVGQELTITDKKYTVMKDGNGKTFEYEILEAPDADTLRIMLKTQNKSSTIDLHRDGDFLWTIDGGILIGYKRKQ